MNQQFKSCMKVKKDGIKWGIILMITLSKTNTFQIRYLILIQMSLIIYHIVLTIRDQATEARTWITLKNQLIGPNHNYKIKDVFIRSPTPGMRWMLPDSKYHNQTSLIAITSKYLTDNISTLRILEMPPPIHTKTPPMGPTVQGATSLKSVRLERLRAQWNCCIHLIRCTPKTLQKKQRIRTVSTAGSWRRKMVSSINNTFYQAITRPKLWNKIIKTIQRR